jgi:hypothetical protein
VTARTTASAQPRPTGFADVPGEAGPQQAFDVLVERLRQRYACAPRRTSRSLWSALEEARLELASGGGLSEALSIHLRDCVARDLHHLAAVVVRESRGTVQELGRSPSKRAEGTQGLLLDVLDMAGDGIYRLASGNDRSAERRAGEVTCAGAVSCVRCGRVLRSPRSWSVQPCPDCGGKSFLKSP